MDLQDWATFAHPDFEFSFRYPDPSPAGQPVKKLFGVRGEGQRIHVMTESSGELYFELSRYPPSFDVALDHQRLKEDLRRRFEDAAFTALTPAVLAGHAGQTFTFSWSGGRRVFHYLGLRQAVYRLVYDPRSELNLAVLSTLAAS